MSHTTNVVNHSRGQDATRSITQCNYYSSLPHSHTTVAFTVNSTKSQTTTKKAESASVTQVLHSHLRMVTWLS